jgi:hypothetical protein
MKLLRFIIIMIMRGDPVGGEIREQTPSRPYHRAGHSIVTQNQHL